VVTLPLNLLPLYNLCDVVANMESTRSLVDVTALMACHAPIVSENATTCDGTKVLVLSSCLVCVV
jgi:hypothetical protein